jgi:hypothetical protein
MSNYEGQRDRRGRNYNHTCNFPGESEHIRSVRRQFVERGVEVEGFVSFERRYTVRNLVVDALVLCKTNILVRGGCGIGWSAWVVDSSLLGAHRCGY